MKAWSPWLGVLGVVAVAGANLQIDFPATRLGTGPYNTVSRVSADAVLQLDGVDQAGRLAANVVFQGGIPPSVSLVWAYDTVFEGLMDQGTSVTLRDLQVHLTCQEGFPRLSYERGAEAAYTYQTGVPFPLNLPASMPDFATLDCQTPPQCGLSAGNLDFGTVGPDESATHHLTLTNHGGGVLAGEAVTDCAAYTVQNAAYAIGPGGQHVLTIHLQSPVPGRYTCALDVGGGCGTVSLDGEVATPPTCTVDVSQLDFGTTQVGLPVSLSFVLTNTGLEPLTGDVLPGCTAFQVADGHYDLAPGESQTVQVTLLALQPGSFACELDTGGSCPDLPMLGTVTLAPTCQLSTTTLAFGSVEPGVVFSQSFTVTNVGGGVLGGRVTEACAPFSVINGTWNLGAGQSQQVTVSFLGSSGGTHTCVLQAGTCGELTAEAEVVLPPVCMLSTTQLEFGPTQPGVPVTRTFLVTNTGGGVLSGSVAPACGNFLVSNGTYNLAAQESQLVTVTLTPQHSQPITCLLDVGATCGTIQLRAGTNDQLGDVWGECFCQPVDPQNPNYTEFPPVGDPSVLAPYHILRMTGASGHDSYLQSPGRFDLYGRIMEVVVSLAMSECAEALGIYLTPLPLTAVPGQPVLPAGLSLVLDRNAEGAQLDVYNDGLQVATAWLPIYDSNFQTLRVRYDELGQWVRVDHFEYMSEEQILAWTDVNGPSSGYLGFGGFGAQGCQQYLDDICVWLTDEMGFEIGIPDGGPLEFALEPAAPNPFNPVTTLRFTMADTGPVRLKVFNLAGQQVAVLVDGMLERGRHEVRFDAAALASGVYFATLEAAGFCETRRMSLVK